MADNTERIRKYLTADIADKVESNDESKERARLEKIYGQVWDTKEVQQEFTVHSFLAPFVSVTEKKTGQKGVLTFQHMPRFYYDFMKS